MSMFLYEFVPPQLAFLQDWADAIGVVCIVQPCCICTQYLNHCIHLDESWIGHAALRMLQCCCRTKRKVQKDIAEKDIAEHIQETPCVQLVIKTAEL